LKRKCHYCETPSSWNSGQRISTVIGQYCGFNNLEELRLALAFFSTSDASWSVYSHIMHAAGLKPVSKKRFRTFTVWLRQFVAVVWMFMQDKARGDIQRRDPAVIGSWLRMVLSADCFWTFPSKKNHAGSSVYGAVPLVDFFMGYIISARVGTLVKQVDDDAHKVDEEVLQALNILTGAASPAVSDGDPRAETPSVTPVPTTPSPLPSATNHSSRADTPVVTSEPATPSPMPSTTNQAPVSRQLAPSMAAVSDSQQLNISGQHGVEVRVSGPQVTLTDLLKLSIGEWIAGRETLLESLAQNLEKVLFRQV
jgi:hypothetical protein